MSHNPVALVGSIVERKPNSQSTPKVFSPLRTPTGFPTVQHRSQSVFARNNQASRIKEPTRSSIPTVTRSNSQAPPPEPVDWRDQISRDNDERIANMTEEERERERRDIVEHLGVEVEDLVKRVKLAREKQAREGLEPQPPVGKSSNDTLEEVPVTAHERSKKQPESLRLSPPPPALSASSTRPSSRADRKLRFANVQPEDIHVYESAPPSPRRKVLALPPPTNDGSTISLGRFSGKSKSKRSPESFNSDLEPEEGSAEYIRRRFFPDAPQNDPSLAWMQPSSEPDSSYSSLRFDLSGKPITAQASSSLPTHLGLHHHAEGVHAGYSLDDIFLLSRSTVPAQRASMLGVLSGITKRLSRMKDAGSKEEEIEGMEEMQGTEEEVRRRILAAGIEAIAERGSVGARAVDVIWQCVVGWDPDFSSPEDIELEMPTDLAMSTLRLNFFLPEITTLLLQGAIPRETQAQLLGILHRVAKHSNEFAASIVTTPRLVPSILQTFLSPLPAAEPSVAPDPLAIELLIVLAKATRENAVSLQEAADALLRFVTFLPSSSMYPSQLATTLLTSTLRFYNVLAKYGLSSHIASTAMEPFTQLAQYILSDSCSSPMLMAAWTNLRASWTTCAVDPHQTTPNHEILWSQIAAWGWNLEADALGRRLGSTEVDWMVWASIWKVHTAWLDGARVNGIKGGLTERMECLEVIKGGFENGKEKEVVLGCVNAIQRDLGHLHTSSWRVYVAHLRALSVHAMTLVAAMKLWLSCLPPLSAGHLDSPPFPLPFPQISELCARLTVHPVWSQLASKASHVPSAYVYLASLSDLLSCFLRLSRRLPGVSDALWAAQALSILTDVLPGGEDFVSQTIDDLFSLFKPEWFTSLGIQTPPIVWDKGGLFIIKPFIARTIRPHRDVHITLFDSTPYSIAKTTTQRLPSADALRTYGLPIPREWTLMPLDHLLRFASSDTIPSDWDASEVDVVRASLILAKASREILHHYGLSDFTMTQGEVVFGCMKLFMLEHNQDHNDSEEEVFRDRLVDQLMEDVLRPYTIAATSAALTSFPVIPQPIQGNLEQVSTRFLGNTPFYQYYTDFVALYDSISFSHPLFARLLLPPTSMRYPLDYRKYLWNDFSHVLKTVRTPIEEVISVDIKEYLWPIETDGQMVGYYLRALLKERPQGFVRLVALHHVAANIWTDLHDDDGEERDDRANKLLKTVVSQGGDDLVREIARYRQMTTGASLTPPQCFEGLHAHVRMARFERTERWGLGDRLRGLFLTEEN